MYEYLCYLDGARGEVIAKYRFGVHLIGITGCGDPAKPLWNLRHVAWRGTELFVSAPARRYGSRPKQPPVGGSQFRFFLSMPKARRMNCEEVVSVVIVTVV